MIYTLVNVLFKVIHAVLEVHKLGYIHRDLKPENFVIMPDNARVKLINFDHA